MAAEEVCFFSFQVFHAGHRKKDLELPSRLTYYIGVINITKVPTQPLCYAW